MKKRLRIIRAMAAMVFILAMMLNMVSCGSGSNTAAEEPDGTAPPSASVSPGVATAKPSATVQPGTPVKPTVGGTTSGSTGTSAGGTTAKPGSTTGGTSATETPEASTQPTTTPTPSTTQKPAATPTPTPVPTTKPSKPTPTPVPTPIPTPFTTPVPATPNPTQGPVKQPDPTPTPHVHEWETTTVHHDAVTQEKVIPAHYEGSQWDVWICNDCGAEFTSYAAWDAHNPEHGGYHSGVRDDIHLVPDQTVTEVVTPAWDETITRCKTCGATQ